MLISRKLLQEYIIEPLPSIDVLSDALTMHSCEVESAEGDILDLKILPDRASTWLSHRGVAREIAALLKLTYKEIETGDVRGATGVSFGNGSASENTSLIRVTIADPKLCRRYSAVVVENVTVTESPVWLREALESLGQKSINTIVDITNYVMFMTGQPMHAFDANKIGDVAAGSVGAAQNIAITPIAAETTFNALDGKTYTLPVGTLCITEGAHKIDSENILGIAGIKGGMKASVDSNTTKIIFEAAHFNATAIRKTAQMIGLRTDASKRFENNIAPDFTVLAINYALALLQKINQDAKVVAFSDTYPKPVPLYKVGVSLRDISRTLGVNVPETDIIDIFARLGFQSNKVKPLDTFMNAVASVLGATHNIQASVLYDAPRSFDCSSLVAWAAVQAGIALPRMSVDQYVATARIDKNDLKVGDLIFAHSGKGDHFHTKSIEYMKGTVVPAPGIDHVGVYMGNDEVIHTSRYTGSVVKENIAAALQFATIIGYGRITELHTDERYVVTIPFDRVDLRIKENLIEEIGRVYGYEHIPEKEITVLSPESRPRIEKKYFYTETIRAFFAEHGFSEVYNYSFVGDDKGVELANPLASDKAFLRTSLVDGLSQSAAQAYINADLLGLSTIKLFEIGKVFEKSTDGMIKEYTSCAFVIHDPKNKKIIEIYKQVAESLEKILGIAAGTISSKCEQKSNNYISTEFNLDDIVAVLPEPDAQVILPTYARTSNLFKPISSYPFASRDIAVFIPGEEQIPDPLGALIREHAGPLLVHARRFDVFTKKATDTEGIKTSYAYRLVFQSHERTLTDDEINAAMNAVGRAIAEKEGWIIR